MLEFEWDEEKAAFNLEKHGISFEEASSVFDNPFALIISDSDHSEDEFREIIIGHSAQWKVLFVSFTQRQTALRIISARRATPKEQKAYEQNSQD